MNNECSFENINNTEIYSIIKNRIIQNYSSNGESIIIEAENNYVFQITTQKNEKNSLNGKYENKYYLSMIDLGDCEELLKKENNIGENENLIIFKFEKLTNIASEKNAQYEVYNPQNLKQLDLSICDETLIDLYIPIELSEKIQNLYNDLQESGYDLFNINDSFYTDICTPYESENGTDVLLSDRKKDFYNANETTCQTNCEYSAYSSETKFLKCECNVISENLDIEEPDKFNGNMIINSFYNVIKNSNFKVFICYKLVFNLDILKKNIGSIIAIIYFLFYLIFFIIFIFKGVSPLKVQLLDMVSKKLIINNNNIINNNINNNNIINNNIINNNINNNNIIISKKNKKKYKN